MSDLSNLPLPWKLANNRKGPVCITQWGGDALQLSGTSNYGNAAQEYANGIAALDDEKFISMAEQAIWLAAKMANNPRSDYHWQADACYYEAGRRGKPDLYQQAYDQTLASAGL